ITPGGFCFGFEDGSKIDFDFMESTRIPDPSNKRKMVFVLNRLDISYNPESENLGDLLFKKEITSIDDFYFFTGEKEDPIINVSKVSEVCFYCHEINELLPGVTETKFEEMCLNKQSIAMINRKIIQENALGFKCIHCGKRKLTETFHDDDLHYSFAKCRNCGAKLAITYNKKETKVKMIEDVKDWMKNFTQVK
ncbi:MAG: hypothetical protein IJS94_07590, partial [Clostridia bacterium]|nr:hypothetical protein [Clostridia bacterium]